MRPRFSTRRRLVLASSLLAAWLGSTGMRGDEPRPAALPTATETKPATVDEAIALVDLSTFPLLDGADEPTLRRRAVLTYTAPGTVREAFAREKQELAGRGWQPTADVQVTAQLANATFAQNGFALAMSIFPYGTPGHVAIAITHLGNVDLQKLPVPGNAKLVFPGRAGAAFVTDTPADEAAAACRKMLSELGWQPYGGGGDTMILKQNGVRLTAQVRPAPGKADRTMVSYSCALVSADLPAPADATRVEYNDQTTELVFDTQAGPSEIVDLYRRTLAKADWKQAADRAPAVEAEPALALTNANHDRVTLQIDRVEGKNRVRVKHQTGAEVQQPAEKKPQS